MRTINKIIVHHTATDRDTTHVEAVDRYHRDKDWGDGARIAKSNLGWYVAYHYFIEADGRLIQTAEDGELRWHSGAENSDSIGICLAGYFDPGHDDKPTEAQTETLKKLLQELTEKYGIPPERIYPHRKFASKSCYGNNLPDDWAASLARETKVTPKESMDTPTTGSPKYKLDQLDLKKVGTGFLLAIGGVALTEISKMIFSIDFVINMGGQEVNLTPIVYALAGAAINAARKWLADNGAK